MNKKPSILIIGAGPAGLTAGYQLINLGYKVTILESDPTYVGGISRTVKYNGYHFDIGGHRFFSKNKEVVKFWDDILGSDFLIRPRLSRWYYRGKFFHYPIKPFELLGVFGPWESLLILSSYLYSRFFPIKPEISLADWCINNFGKHLAKPFFINYNLKLWGVDPKNLSKDFSMQRIKGVSFIGTILDYFKKIFGIKNPKVKSLIEEFKYPKYGPGMLWEKVAELFNESGGKIIMNATVVKIIHNKDKIEKIIYRKNNKEYMNTADIILSTMPLAELVFSLSPEVPEQVMSAAKSLKYRDFITVALMLENVKTPPDNWIYTHDDGIKAIRIQLFKNWSPYMVPDKSKTCIGFEYTCDMGDEFWNSSDSVLIKTAKSELIRLGFADASKVIDAKVVRLKKVYPTYLLNYSKKVKIIKDYLDSIFHNYSLQPLGRSGLHRYNNSDHSMMTAFLCVKNINEHGNYDQWDVNSDAMYHEENQTSK